MRFLLLLFTIFISQSSLFCQEKYFKEALAKNNKVDDYYYVQVPQGKYLSFKDLDEYCNENNYALRDIRVTVVSRFGREKESIGFFQFVDKETADTLNKIEAISTFEDAENCFKKFAHHRSKIEVKLKSISRKKLSMNNYEGFLQYISLYPEKEYSICEDLSTLISKDNQFYGKFLEFLNQYLAIKKIKPLQRLDLKNEKIVADLSLKMTQHKFYDAQVRKQITYKLLDSLNVITLEFADYERSQYDLTLQNSNLNVAHTTAFQKRFPNSKYNNLLNNEIKKRDNEKWEKALNINTEASFQDYLKSSPTGSYVQNARKQIEELKTKMILEKKNQEAIEAKKKIFEKNVTVSDKFIWVGEGNRTFINDVFENSRNTYSGGKNFNVFGYGEVVNKLNRTIKVEAKIKLNIIETSNLSIFISQVPRYYVKSYFVELKPREKKSLVVLFKDISEGFRFNAAMNDRTLGGALFSAGSQTRLADNPIEISLEEYSGEFPIGEIEKQNSLMTELKKYGGNVRVDNKSQRDKLDEVIAGWTNSPVSKRSYLRIYFTKNSTGKANLEIYDENSKLIKTDEFTSSGKKAESYDIIPNKNYYVSIPGCTTMFPVYAKGKITHLIIDDKCKSIINTEDQE
jgi:hypothetical protein